MSALSLIMTTAGLGRFTAAQVQDDIDLTVAQVGFTASEFVAAPSLTALPGEFRRVSTISGASVGDNIVHMIVRDEAPLGYTVRGFGLFLADGTLFAVYGQSAPICEKSPLTTLLMPLDIAFPTSAIDKLEFGDTNFLNPPATSALKGVVRFATQAESDAGTAGQIAVSPADIRRMLPIGTVTMWYGTAATVPAGWAICNGQEVNRSDGAGKIVTPDLRDRVPVGAGGALNPGVTFGEAQKTVASTNVRTGVTIGTTSKNDVAGGGTGVALASATLTDPGHAHQVTIDVNQPSRAILFIMKV